MSPRYKCILLYVKLIQCSGIYRSMIKWRGGTSALSICALCYMLNLFGIVVFHRSMVSGSGALVYVHYAICETDFGVVVFHTSMIDSRVHVPPCALGIGAFCYMLNLFGVVVFHTSMDNWRRRGLVYVHSTICETYLVQWYSIDVWMLGGGTMCLRYMFILLYVKLMWCSGFHSSMINWRRGSWYVCLLLYVKPDLVQGYSISIYG